MKLSSPVALLVAFLLALIVVFVIDPLDKTTLSTPFCLGMILMWLSLRQAAWVVLAVTIFYCVIDFYATELFLESFSGRHSTEHPYFWFFQRFGLFIVVCVMAVYLSYHREESEKNLKHIQGILGKLPAPVVISDATGLITYANEALCSLFGKASPELIGKRYLELFMTNIDEGKAMRYYIELFGSDDENAPEVELLTLASPSAMKASLTCMGKGTQRSMITVLRGRLANGN